VAKDTHDDKGSVTQGEAEAEAEEEEDNGDDTVSEVDSIQGSEAGYLCTIRARQPLPDVRSMVIKPEDVDLLTCDPQVFLSLWRRQLVGGGEDYRPHDQALTSGKATRPGRRRVKKEPATACRPPDPKAAPPPSRADSASATPITLVPILAISPAGVPDAACPPSICALPPPAAPLSRYSCFHLSSAAPPFRPMLGKRVPKPLLALRPGSSPTLHPPALLRHDVPTLHPSTPREVGVEGLGLGARMNSLTPAGPGASPFSSPPPSSPTPSCTMPLLGLAKLQPPLAQLSPLAPQPGSLTGSTSRPAVALPNHATPRGPDTVPATRPKPVPSPRKTMAEEACDEDLLRAGYPCLGQTPKLPPGMAGWPFLLHALHRASPSRRLLS
jgi:hypothetical protein